MLPISDKNINTLLEKHLPAAPALKESLLNGPIAQVPSSYFDNVDETLVEKALTRLNRVAGPSNID